MAIVEKKAVKFLRQELTPVSWIERAGVAYADRVAAVDGDVRYTWRELRARSRRMASAFRRAGLKKDDRIAILALNSEPMLLAHFGVPQAGGILVAINTRLSADEVAYIVEHSGSGTVIYTPELEPLLANVPRSVRRLAAGQELEEFLATGSDEPVESWLEDEYDTIAIDYTSGTTGRPKGVEYHHRGAYLNALAMLIDQGLTADSKYLWTLPMFHCNGWTFTWSMAAVGATSVCLGKVDPEQCWDLFKRGEATNFCGAPTVLIMIANHPSASRLDKPVRLFVAAAPPSPTILGRMAELNFEVVHVYGLTETYGPFTVNVPPRDVGVMHPDGFIELRDRKKDVIISGGENISTIEVQQAVESHPAVLESAVIAIPDDKWGEVPKAFVTLKPGSSATEQEIIDHVRG